MLEDLIFLYISINFRYTNLKKNVVSDSKN